MLTWDKSTQSINLPASKVVALFRSMREVQLALPGVPAQQASAYLCQYQAEAGVGTAAVFHLHKSHVLAFYVSDPKFVPEQDIDNLLDQGLNMVESMGFLMTDQDLHLLDEADQEMLWASLPLKTGLSKKEAVAPVATPQKQTAPRPVEPAKPVKPTPSPEKNASSANPISNDLEVKKTPAQSVNVTPQVAPEPETTENVDDLLAAVEAMRAKRPGLRARKTPPSPEEMNRRRLKLRETVGRILASL
jgi:hypothetical protein